MSPDLRARSLPWGLSLAFHGALLLAIALLPPPIAPVAPSSRLSVGRIGAGGGGSQELLDALPEAEWPEETLGVAEVAAEPLIQDVALADHHEAASDLPFQESFGAGEGISDAPSEGPATNGFIGVGGGAGAAYRGRGGSRDLRAGGGGRRALESSDLRSPLEPHLLRLRVGDTEDLPLRHVLAKVRVEGFRARVTLDATFFNDRSRVLEGTFQIRLPDGATPALLAFGEAPVISGARAASLTVLPPAELALAAPGVAETAGLRFARFAPRERAATAYRETARRRVDPALLEWSAAGVFDARVFPLQPRKDHRVVVAYDAPLVPEGEDLAYRFSFPASIPALDVDLTVHGFSAEVKPGAPHADGHFRYHDPARRAWRVRIPRPGSALFTTVDAAVGPLFVGVARPDVPAARPRPSRRAVFLVDLSSSTDASRLARALDLLEAILGANRATVPEFAVAFFHVETWWWREDFSANLPEEVAALRAHATSLVVGGATDLAGALETVAARPGDHDVFLLGDGSATWGRRDADAVLRAAGRAHPVFSYGLGEGGTDTALLERLARETGGAFFAVVPTEPLAALATRHAVVPWRIVGTELEGADDLLIAGRPNAVYPGQVLTIVGRGTPAEGGGLVLDLESAGVRRRVRTHFPRRLPSDLVASAYGRVAVEHLEGSNGGFGDLAEAYALHFGVVCSRVSLVMLESDDQYARYGIDPERNVLAVQSSEPGRLVARRDFEGASGPADPRAPLRAWIHGLRRAAPEGAVDDRAFAELLAILPAEALRDEGPGVGCRARRWVDLGQPVAAALRAERLSGEALDAAATEVCSRWGAADALRVLSALVEEAPGDGGVLRVVGYRALAWGRASEASWLLASAAALRPDAPQGYAALGSALADAGLTEIALLAYEASLAVRKWPDRFREGRRIVAAEYLSLLMRVARGSEGTGLHAWAERRVEEIRPLVGFADADLVVTIAWSTDETDVDLHVVDPAGEDCHYAHPKTALGGSLTPDVIQGFGPEMFVLPRAAPGEYVAKVVYYRSDDRRLSLRSVVVVKLHERWGRADERVRREVVQLASGRQEAEVLRLRLP